MKGDIAVAGFMISAEEWQAFDLASRAQLVEVITRKHEPRLASGSGPIAMDMVEIEIEADEPPPGLSSDVDLDFSGL